MTSAFTSSVVEQAAASLVGLCWRVTHGLEIAPGESKAERIIGRVC
jgi:hypothetical protein